MHATIATLAGLVALTNISPHAIPLPSAKATTGELSSAPSIELVRQGYDRGGHSVQWEYWHWGRHFPNW
jgi:hypothetical protein